jgi:ferredoxin-like protein FixX
MVCGCGHVFIKNNVVQAKVPLFIILEVCRPEFFTIISSRLQSQRHMKMKACNKCGNCIIIMLNTKNHSYNFIEVKNWITGKPFS